MLLPPASRPAGALDITVSVNRKKAPLINENYKTIEFKTHIY